MSTIAPAATTLLEQTVSIIYSIAGYMRIPALLSSGVATVLTCLLYFKQKALIYPSHMPANSRTDIPHPSHYKIEDFEELIIPTPDGEKLSAFYIRAPRGTRNSRVTVLMFHGNAGNIGHRLPIARLLIGCAGCNVFMLEYRGYGASTGEPGESGINIDAQTGLDYLRQRADTCDHQIVVFGQSIGGAVGARLVAKNQDKGPPIAGMILENTFLSMRKLIPSIIPPARFLAILCHQVWSTESLISSVKVPTLFLSGLQDEIVPPAHMKRLYELCCADMKVWQAFAAGDHNSSVLEEGYFESIAEFIDNVTNKEAVVEKTKRPGTL